MKVGCFGMIDNQVGKTMESYMETGSHTRLRGIECRNPKLFG